MISYYYCAIAENAFGMAFGEIEEFVPGAIPPVVTTEAATAITGTTATVTGTADPRGTDATGWFRYGATDPGTCDDSFGTRGPLTGGAMLGAGTEPVGYEEPLTGLEPSSIYFYCAAAQNLGGAAFGEVLSFTTEAAPPTVRTIPAVVGARGAARPPTNIYFSRISRDGHHAAAGL